MIEIAELTSRRTLKLPADIAARFRPSNRFVVWVEGDVLNLKRITPPRVTKIVAQAAEGERLSADEINEVVHEVRGQSKAKLGTAPASYRRLVERMVSHEALEFRTRAGREDGLRGR